MKTVKVDRWEGPIEIQVPKSAEIVEAEVRGEKILDPEEAIREALRNPLGMKPIKELVNSRSRVAVAFDDPMKPSPSYLTIPLILDELREAGVKDENIVLVSATGMHPRRFPGDFIENRRFGYGLPAGMGYRTLPEKIVNEFWPWRWIRHDATNPEVLVKMGYSKLGALVEHNKVLVDYDLVIYSGSVGTLELGGYSGTGVVVGLGSARTTSFHHSQSIVGHEESFHSDPQRQLYRRHKDTIMERIEEYTGKQVFYIEGVGNSARQWTHFSAGHFKAIREPIIRAADRVNLYPVDQADVVIAGLAKHMGYDTTRNPIICLFAGARILRVCLEKPVLREGGVMILVAQCDGGIDTVACPSHPEVLDLYGKIGDVRRLEEQYTEEFLAREDYIKKYTYGYAIHAIHPFNLLSVSQRLHDYAGKLIIATAENPEAVRKVGATWARDFTDAWRMAERIVGKNPRTLVLPNFFTRPSFKFAVK